MKLDRIGGRGNEDLYRHPKTKIIYYKKYRSGRGEFCKSTHTTELTKGKAIADGYRLEFLGETKVKRGQKFCGELFPAWIERKRVSTRKKTITSIAGSWAHLKPFLDTMLPEEVTAAWWESVYVPKKRSAGNNKRKFFNDRKWLAMFLLSLKRDGVLDKTPMLIDVDPPRAPGKVYSDEEVGRLLKHAGPELKLQILMGVTMGMRIGEIMGMTWDRIDLDARTMHLTAAHTKTKKARTFGISDQVLSMINDRFQEFEASNHASLPLFASPDAEDKAQSSQGNKRAWATCKRKAGVVGRYHDLRHTFLTKAFKCQTNPALICHYAGLSLDEAEKTYLHFTPEDTRVVSTLVLFIND